MFNKLCNHCPECVEWEWICGSLIVLDIVKLFPIRNVQVFWLLIASDLHRYMALSDSICFVTSVLLFVKGVVNFNLPLLLVSLLSSFITLLMLPLFISAVAFSPEYVFSLWFYISERPHVLVPCIWGKISQHHFTYPAMGASPWIALSLGLITRHLFFFPSVFFHGFHAGFVLLICSWAKHDLMLVNR